MRRVRENVLFVELTAEDRASVQQLAAASGMALGRPVSVSEVVRQIVRDAAKKKTPIRIAT